MKRVILNCLLLIVVLLLNSHNSCQAQATSFRIAGASNTYIMGINDNLWAAGYYTNAQGTFGFIYNQSDTILVAYPGAVNTLLYDINNSGEAVGVYNSGSSANNVGFKYNIYTQAFTVITSWISGYTQIIPYKINNAGDVGGSYRLTTNNWMFLMIGSTNIGSLHYNYKPTYGVGLNDNDVLAGFCIDGGQYHAVLRSAAGVFSSFDYPGAFKTRAHGINDSMKVVGEFNNTRGFIYKTTSPASFQEIIIPGVTEIHPYDINDHGYIAGYFRDTDASMAGFILMDKFEGELHFMDNLTAEALGVAADGVAGIKLRVKRTYGNSTINSIKIELEEPNNDAYNPVGKIGTSEANADTNFITVNNPAGTDEWDFYYLAPTVFTYQPMGGFYREVRAKITLHNNATNTDYFCEKMIRIIRPPVLLVHGLISEGAAFQNAADYLVATGKYTKETAFSVDYKPSNQVAFTRNSYVYPTNIRMGKARCRKIGYEVKKFDVVGHSMGAILARMYLQSDDYKDDMNRLITVNSPLSGSQGANVLASLPMYVRQKAGIEGQAFDDLCVTSDAIRHMLNGPPFLNHNLVPSYAITSTANSLLPAFPKSILGAAMYIAFRYYMPTTSLAIELVVPIMFNGPSDLVVAENSQLAGCSAFMQIPNEWHSGITTNATAKLAISNLLEEPPSSPVFSKTGFNPPTLLWMGQKLQPFLNTPLTDSVQFIQPLAGSIKTNGDTLNIAITGTSGISRLLLYIRKSADSVFLLDTVTSSLTYQYIIPALSCGKMPIDVFAFDATGNMLTDSTYVIVQPSATPDSLFITSPADSLLLPIGLPGKIYVACLYSDGITRDISALPGVQYQLQGNKALSLGGGTLKGIQAGNDLVTVSFAGLSASLPIYVDAFYPRFDTVNISAVICPDSTYTFNGVLLDSAGTYYASFINQYGNDSTIVLSLVASACSAASNLGGTLTYDNTAGTPMDAATVSLTKNGILIDQDTSLANGSFSFGNLPHGNYEISVSTGKPWGGVNSVDALRIAQHFVGLTNLTGIRLKAADVNGFSGVNSVDALVNMKRFVGIFNSFVVGDWLWSANQDTITLNSDTIYHIKGICYGDVNGSYNPSLKTSGTVLLSEEGSLPCVSNAMAEIPVRTKEGLSISSVSLILRYNSDDANIKGVIPVALSPDEENSYFISNITDNEIRIAWFSLLPLELNAGETLFSVQLQPKNTGLMRLGISPESMMTDEQVQDIPVAEINYPKLVFQGSGFEFNCCSPNPIIDVTDISYFAPSKGTLHLVLSDALGKKTEVLPLINITEGSHKFRFDATKSLPGGFTNGVYWMIAEFDDGTSKVVRTSKVVILR